MAHLKVEKFWGQEVGIF